MIRVLSMPIVRTVKDVAIGLLAAAVLLVAGAASAAAAPSGTPCAATARACVDLSAQRAWLLRDGTVSYGPVPVATGMASAPTHLGVYRVFWKDLHHRSSLFNNAPMPYSVFFDGGEAFHEDNTAVPLTDAST